MEEIKKPDISIIHSLVIKLKTSLQNGFGQVYIESKINLLNDEDQSRTTQALDSNIFKLEQKNEPIYKKINSVDDLSKIKDEIKSEYKNTIDDFFNLFEKVEDQLDDSVEESLEIIGKTLQNRSKKLDSSFKKFKIEDSWDIEKLQDEFAKVLQKQLKDILESTMPSINIGLKTNSVYEKVVVILNTFYSSLGIYTKEFVKDDDISNKTNYIEIIQMPNDEIKDISFKDKISYVESPAYLFESEFIILEAKVSVWRVS
ncbi:MAG: hypothetical protein DRG78_22265 [Epsilonproteobacteria bacterium]|nr:MAG: hypothetical protein DRG78_22265 [Campylobacterota bacterium]